MQLIRTLIIRVSLVLLGLLAAITWSGCSTSGYRASADKAVYGILQDKQKAALGHTNAFSIDTPYSDRKLDEIKAPEIISDRQDTNKLVLTLSQALDVYFTNSPAYKTQKEQLYLSALSLGTTRNTLGSTLRVTPAASAATTFTRAVNGSGQATETASATGVASLGFHHLFASGANLSLSLVNSVTDFYLGDGGRSAISTLSGTFTQPLLRGFGARSPDVESLTQAERGVIYQVRTFAHNQNTLAVDLVSSYLSLLQRQDSLQNSWAAFTRSQTNALRAKAMGIDRMTQVEVDQAVQQEFSARNSYIVAVQQYYTSLDSFKITLGLPLGVDLFLDTNALDEIEVAGLLPFDVPEEAAYLMGLTNRLDLLNVIDQFEDSVRTLKNEADKSKPGLDLTARASLANLGQNNYADFLDWNINRYNTTAGLQLVLPVDRLPIRNSYRQASIRFEQAIRSLATQIDNLKRDIRTGIRGLAQNRQSYEIQLASRETAQRQVESTKIQFENGDIEFRQVTDAEQSLINAQNAVTQILVDYTIARLRLLQNMGVLKTDLDKFWLQAQLPAPEQGGMAPAAERSLISTELVPPDKLFEK